MFSINSALIWPACFAQAYFLCSKSLLLPPSLSEMSGNLVRRCIDFPGTGVVRNLTEVSAKRGHGPEPWMAEPPRAYWRLEIGNWMFEFGGIRCIANSYLIQPPTSNFQLPMCARSKVRFLRQRCGKSVQCLTRFPGPHFREAA